jgi:diguanylate cyclase (GGDEF)-like protein/PAS domain S-box-containing protein
MHKITQIISFFLWIIFAVIVSVQTNIRHIFLIPMLTANGMFLIYLFQQIAKSGNWNANNFDTLQQMILNEACYAIIATDTKGIITFFNPAAEKMLGYQAEEFIGKETPAIFHAPEEIAQRAAEFSKELNQPLSPGFEVFIAKSRHGLPNMHEWTYIRKDGSRLSVMLGVSALRNYRNEIIGFLGIASDITAQHQSQFELAAAREQLSIAAKMADLGVWVWNVTDDSLIWNDRMFEIYQQPMELRKKGLLYTHWSSRLHPEDALEAEFKLKNAVEGKGVFDTNFRIILPDGKTHYIQAAGQIERDQNGKIFRVTGINLDITRQHEYEKLLREMAYIDGLTNIPNRRSFEESLASDIRYARRARKPLALLMIDVDYFKSYNDKYGHQAGDECLKKIAATLKLKMFRPKDIVARYGGEEFVCLLPETNEEGARRIANRLCKAIEKLNIAHSTSKAASVVTISIGFAILDPLINDISPATLTTTADTQLYQAKNEGRNRVKGVYA